MNWFGLKLWVSKVAMYTKLVVGPTVVFLFFLNKTFLAPAFTLYQEIVVNTTPKGFFTKKLRGAHISYPTALDEQCIFNQADLHSHTTHMPI